MVDLIADERRAVGVPERRRYNRRIGPEVNPPYYEVFDRIATALEGIQRAMNLKDVKTAPVASVGVSADHDAARGGVSEH